MSGPPAKGPYDPDRIRERVEAWGRATQPDLVDLLAGLIVHLHVPRSLGSIMVPAEYDKVRDLIGDYGWSTHTEVAERLRAHLRPATGPGPGDTVLVEDQERPLVWIGGDGPGPDERLRRVVTTMTTEPECWCGAVGTDVHAIDCREIGLDRLRAALAVPTDRRVKADPNVPQWEERRGR